MGRRARRAIRAIERGRPAVLRAPLLGPLAVLVACALLALGGAAMIGNGLFGLEPGERRYYGGLDILPGGILVVLFFGVFGVPVAIWNLRGRRRALVLDRQGLHMEPRCHLPWSAIVTAGGAGGGERARAWVEVTPAGAAAEPYLVADAADLFAYQQVRDVPGRAVVLPNDLGVSPSELAELVRLALAHHRTEV